MNVVRYTELSATTFLAEHHVAMLQPMIIDLASENPHPWRSYWDETIYSRLHTSPETIHSNGFPATFICRESQQIWGSFSIQGAFAECDDLYELVYNHNYFKDDGRICNWNGGPGLFEVVKNRFQPDWQIQFDEFEDGDATDDPPIVLWKCPHSRNFEAPPCYGWEPVADAAKGLTPKLVEFKACPPIPQSDK